MTTEQLSRTQILLNLDSFRYTLLEAHHFLQDRHADEDSLTTEADIETCLALISDTDMNIQMLVAEIRRLT